VNTFIKNLAVLGIGAFTWLEKGDIGSRGLCRGHCRKQWHGSDPFEQTPA
jgi:hypothetical protein